MPKMINVLIVDNHPVVRKGLKQIIQEQSDMQVGGEAADGQEALDMIRDQDWDVVVLEIFLPFRNGMEILQEVRHSKPTLPVLILSAHSETQFGMRMLKAGAAGYLNKASALGELVAAIRKAATGGKYVSPVLAEILALELQEDAPRAPCRRLTDREYMVVCLMAAGKSPREIASELSLSVKTISTYRARALHKLGLKTNAELLRYIIENEFT